MGRQSKSEEPVFNQIARFRKEKGLSRRDLAEQAGVHYQTIGYLERGEYAPSLYLALKLCELLGHRMDEIFSLTDPSDSTTSTSTDSPPIPKPPQTC